jgi:hypothetical protein
MHLYPLLEEEDNKFYILQSMIDQKRNYLMKKNRQLNKMAMQNEFLNEVKEDYMNYYNYISKQKLEQIKALELLNVYINDLKTAGQLSKHNLEDAKFEQTRIMKEINSIKRGLDSIIYDTDDIYRQLQQQK